jgi:2,4-dichlorophenol 6-monooxygenase
MRRVEVPVLVVGAGPVGLTASLLLARQGIPSRVVERRPGPHRAPQAHVVNPRTLEIFRQMGIETARLRRLATPREDGGHVSFMTTLGGRELGRLPYERQDDGVLACTPEPIINLPQHVLEPVLVEHVEAARGVALAWNEEWLSLAQDDQGVTSRIRDATGEEYEVRSHWVLAADGAGSRIRKQLGVPMVGPDRLQSFVMIHFEANLRTLVRDRPAILYWIVDPAAPGSFVAHDIEHTWVFMHPFDPETDPVESYDEARCTEVVLRAIGRQDVALAVRQASPWHMTSQVAETYRAGRVFLVGDSAHRFPPAGGMGMNTGIQDAHNLVWKLRLVEERRAGTALLDTYTIERRPVAQRNADQSLHNAVAMLEMAAELGLGGDVDAGRAHQAALLASAEGRERVRRAIEAQQDHFDMLGLQLGFAYDAGAIVPDGTPDAPPRGVRDFVPTARPGARVPHAWVEVEGELRSSLDLLPGDAFTLVAGPGVAVDRSGNLAVRILAVGRDCVDRDGAWLRTCGIRPDGAFLVRPDQHVAWRSPSGVGNVHDALAAVLAPQPG